MWYENSFRRHLADMHIHDWHDGVFLSAFDPAAYVDCLKRGRVKSAMIYLQSHVGYCYFPTRVGHIHSAFAEKPNAMRDLFDTCRREGIDTVIYYSLIYNTIEAQAHPDWLCSGLEAKRDFAGERYLHCCPNNPDYTAFVHEQIREMLSYVQSDGIFFDMPFWPKICTCEKCRAKWQAEHGGNIPQTPEDPAWEAFVGARLRWMNEWIASITQTCKQIRPDISVQHNMASAALPYGEIMDGDGVNELSDYAGGDLYRGMFTHSFACKLYRSMTKHQPFESMTSRCPNLLAHTLSRSKTQLRTALLTATAHHGANLVIDAIDPAGTLDRRFYDELGELFGEIERYEPYLTRGALVSDVAVLLCQAGKYRDIGKASAHYEGALAASETLARLHVPHTVVTEASMGDLSRFRALVLSSPQNISPSGVEKIRAYLAEGGAVYMSGDCQKEFLALIGTKTGMTKQAYTYMAPAQAEQAFWGDFNETYPLPVPQAMPIVHTDGEVLATITLPFDGEYPFASIHSDPPGTKTAFPAAVRKTVGKGTLLWFAAPVEMQPYERVRSVFARYLRALTGRASLETGAPEQVEAIAFASEKEILVSFVYLSDDQTVPTICGFSASVACEWNVREVQNITTGKPIPFRQEKGRVLFDLDALSLFAMIRVEREDAT